LSISDSLDVPDARLLRPEVQEFVRAHVSSDVHELSLKQPAQKFGIPFRDIAVQIAGLQRARHKLPQYFSTPAILYPPPANLEQCSSEKTAMFKARQAAAFSSPQHTRCVDLSGGFGVDTFFLSRQYQEVHYVEPDRALLQIARHNHQQLGALNIIYHERDALSFLNETALTFDLAYVDPSRRTENSQRRIELTAYSPDVRTLVPFLGRTFNRMMLKVSPMLDIDRGLQVITNVARVAIVTASGEVRELLFFSAAGHTAEPLLEAIDLTANRPPFSFYRHEENDALVQYGIPRKYVYMPGPEILKSGAFRLVASRYGLTKLHVNTHLYTSEDLQPDFPGRIFEIIATAHKYTPELASSFPEGMANVVVRNYPLTADQLRSRARLKEGGEHYLLAFTSPEGPMLATAKRIT
jgi:hypothetical protein